MGRRLIHPTFLLLIQTLQCLLTSGKRQAMREQDLVFLTRQELFTGHRTITQTLKKESLPFLRRLVSSLCELHLAETRLMGRQVSLTQPIKLTQQTFA